jgi:ADP-heptose:LPS heptosyltransferase
MKVLVVRFSSIGDIVLTKPVVSAIKKQFPETEIHYLTKNVFHSLLSEDPNIRMIHGIDKSINEKSRIFS